MNNKNRLSKLEKQSGTGEKKKYLCVIRADEEKTDDYKYAVQPFVKEHGGTGGEPFYFSSRKELDEFEARRDVELIVINVLYAGNKDEV